MNASVIIRKCQASDLPALVRHEPSNSRIAEGFLERQGPGT